MFRTAKRKINDVEIEDKIKFMPESKKKKSIEINNLIVDYLKKYSELTCKLHRNQTAYNLQKPKSYI